MGFCRDCTWWRTPASDRELFDGLAITLYDDETHGVCGRTVWNTFSGSLWLKSDNKMTVSAQPAFSDPPIDLDMWLETQADFGCVQFEAAVTAQEA